MTFDTDFLRKTVTEAGGFRPAERQLRAEGHQISERTIRRMLKEIADKPFEVEPMPVVDMNDILAKRMYAFEKKRTEAMYNKSIPIRMNVDGPIGIGFMGDPHVDSDGCNIKLLLRHTEIFDGQHEGLFAGCLGDMWNNWHGRLSRLWAEQTTTGAEARALLEFFLKRVDWMFFVQGNHDLWSGHSDPISLVLSGSQTPVKDWRARLNITLPNQRSVKIYASHRFPGRSMYLQNMGAVKKALLDGQHDIYVSGDSHVAGYTFGTHPGSEKTWHAVQVGTYKEVDSFADEINAEDFNMYTCPVAIIDPYVTSPLNFIRWEFDPEQAIDRLAWMRNRWKSGKTC